MYQDYQNPKVQYKIIEFQAKGVHATIAIPQEDLNETRIGQVKKMDFKVSEYEDHYRRTLMLELHAHVYGMAVDELKVPKSWWQFFKKSHFPEWLLKRYPVQYDIIDIDVVLPEVKASGQRYVIRAFDNTKSPYRY